MIPVPIIEFIEFDPHGVAVWSLDEYGWRRDALDYRMVDNDPTRLELAR